MKPMNRASSLSKREKMRRKPLRRRKQSLNLIAAFVHLSVVLPGVEPGLGRRDDGDEAQVERQLARLVARVGAVQQKVKRPARCAQAGQQFPAHRPVVGLARRQRERYGRSSIRGNHMNLCGPSSARLADGLRAVFFSAPVPSGCTLMMVESSETASMRMRTT